MHFERALHVRAVRRDEDDLRGLVGAERGDHSQAVEVGHLDVEEHEFGTQLRNSGKRLESVRALAENIDVRLSRKQRTEPLAGESLVVND